MEVTSLDLMLAADNPTVTAVLRVEKPSAVTSSFVDCTALRKLSDDSKLSVDILAVDFMLCVGMSLLDSVLSVGSVSLTAVLGVEKPSELTPPLVDSSAVERLSGDFSLSVDNPAVDLMPSVDFTLSVDS